MSLLSCEYAPGGLCHPKRCVVNRRNTLKLSLSSKSPIFSSVRETRWRRSLGGRKDDQLAQTGSKREFDPYLDEPTQGGDGPPGRLSQHLLDVNNDCGNNWAYRLPFLPSDPSLALKSSQGCESSSAQRADNQKPKGKTRRGEGQRWWWMC